MAVRAVPSKVSITVDSRGGKDPLRVAAGLCLVRRHLDFANTIPDPPDQPNLLIAAMAGAGIVGTRPPLAGTVSAPPKAATIVYGEYVAK